MVKAASTALRRCLRSRNASGGCRLSLSSSNRITCIASSICPARTLTSTSSISPLPISTPKQAQRRLQELANKRSRMSTHHGTTESSIQGTVGEGAGGVEDEAERMIQGLIAPGHLNEKERDIWTRLMKELQCTELEVQDISGGCGSMYGIDIVSEKFRGLSMLKQQRLVNQVLGEEIKGWHGVQLKTRAP